MMKLFSVLALAAILAVPAFANDSENSEKTTVDHSDNPLTGSHTTTKKHKQKRKHGSAGTEASTTEKTKVEKDGDVKKDVKVEESATH